MLHADAFIEVDQDITLRRLSRENAQEKFDLIVKNHDHLLPWLPWADFYHSIDDMYQYTDSQIKDFDDGKEFSYDIYYKDQLVGSVGIHDISEDNNRCELGYWLDQDATGKGIMTKAVAKITDYALHDIKFDRVAILAAVENEALRAENMRSRYETLKNQLDPHFLFNSMNTLQSLITVDSDRAEEYVQQLCTVLRYTLQRKEVVTLAEELVCTADYCRMLKIRYGDNLIFDHHINHERYDDYLVPPLAIQGLVENAIKHNVISTKQPLTVHISTDDDEHLAVSNKIQPKVMEEESSGIGLANLCERYRLQWDKKVEIFDDGNNFIVTLPLVKN